MLLELSEVLACPVCGPPQVMVAVVHESVAHRVTTGFLGCPECDSRYPIERGAVFLGRADPATEDARPELDSVAPSLVAPGELAVLVGAVLDLARGSGHVLLGPTLAGIADSLAVLAERWEVVSLASVAHEETTGSAGVSRLIVPQTDRLPVLPGRFGAAALAGEPAAERVREFAASLRPLGRLAIVAPGSAAVEALGNVGLEVIAADDRVAVASRRP